MKAEDVQVLGGLVISDKENYITLPVAKVDPPDVVNVAETWLPTTLHDTVKRFVPLTLAHVYPALTIISGGRVKLMTLPDGNGQFTVNFIVNLLATPFTPFVLLESEAENVVRGDKEDITTEAPVFTNSILFKFRSIVYTVNEPVAIRFDGLVRPSISRLNVPPAKVVVNAPITFIVRGLKLATGHPVDGVNGVVVPPIVTLQPVKAPPLKDTSGGKIIYSFPFWGTAWLVLIVKVY